MRILCKEIRGTPKVKDHHRWCGECCETFKTSKVKISEPIREREIGRKTAKKWRNK